MEPLSAEKLERLEYFLKGDKHALLFCLDMLYIAHVWDDLIDKDRPVSGEEISQAFLKSLSGIPGNPFYQQCMPALMPMIYNAMVLWLESNELRTSPDMDDRVTAYSLENAVIEIIHFCILIKSDTSDWAREIAPEFWRLFGPTSEELSECLGEDYEYQRVAP